MDEFERLLEAERVSVERFVRFRLNSKADADDVLQEVFLAAYQKFPQLKNKDSFKAWVISIARNKCNDYFRKKAGRYEIPIDELTQKQLSDGRHGVSVVYTVRETLSLLGDKDRQMLYLYFWKEMPQAEIAKQLDIPVGTVKSRLHTAKQNFKTQYPYNTDIVGRYTVTIGGKSYDTVCVMDIETYNCGVVSEQFLDKDGKTILWRRYNRDDWAIDRYKKPWSEQLPENDRLIVNGTTYVHWYDCITDRIL